MSLLKIEGFNLRLFDIHLDLESKKEEKYEIR